MASFLIRCSDRNFGVEWFTARAGVPCRTALVLAISLLFAGHVRAQEIELDRTRAEAAGLQVFSGQHVTVVTDARERTDVAEFPEVFDRAVTQWCEYFQIDESRVDTWHVTACVIVDQEAFRRARLFPDDLPPFPAGFQRGDTVWLFVQPGDYYTRHLLLHEGTHAFMQHFLGGFGTPWYAEGMAELLAVHRWSDGQLSLKHAIRDRDEVPWWGRVKLLRDDRDGGKRMTLEEIFSMPAESFREVHAYAWAWAACEFFDRHPALQSTFRALPESARFGDDRFNRLYRDALIDAGNRWSDIEFEWQLMVDEIEYGYNVERAAIVAAAAGQTSEGTVLRLAVDRGWQSTGVAVRAGQRISLSAGDDRFHVRRDEAPWECTASGVTIDYYRGRPLGELVAAIRPVGDPHGGNPEVWNWTPIGSGAELDSQVDGVLYLRINESPAAWDDNEGTMSVAVRPAQD